jgi:3-oxoacyl-[acyl-carrier-protein] synthase II
MGERRIVVTGIGTINPLGKSVSEFFCNLDKGVSGSVMIDNFDPSLFKTRFACEIPNFSAEEFGFDRKESRKLDLFEQYALIAADQAVADSGLDLEKTDLDNVGVILGSGIGGVSTFFEEIMGYAEGGKVPRFSPFLITKVISDMAPGLISIKYGFKGPNYATTSACASSLHALTDALRIIQRGDADIMLTGGTEAPINEFTVGGFSSMRALSTNNDEFASASRPFDATRDGFVLGEGSGVIILEELEHAKARGAKIYAEILGSGVTDDAYHITAPEPEGQGATKAIIKALKDAHTDASEVDYINVHGTSTLLGDLAELKAIANVFGEGAFKINISSTKSMTGHLLGAAGAIETLACIHAINSGIIPPTINLKTPDPNIDPRFNLTPNKAQKREVKVALNNSFGFGGHNCCVVLRKYE